MNVDISEQIDKDTDTKDMSDYWSEAFDQSFPRDRERFPDALRKYVQYLKQWHQEKAEEHLSIVASLSRIQTNFLRDL